MFRFLDAKLREPECSKCVEHILVHILVASLVKHGASHHSRRIGHGKDSWLAGAMILIKTAFSLQSGHDRVDLVL